MPALRVGPVLDRAGRHVAVERVVGERQRLGVAEHPRARGQRRLGAAARELVRALVEHRHVGGVHARHDALGREAGAGARVEHRQAGLQPRLFQRRGAHRRRSRTAGSPSGRSRATGTGRTSTPRACAGSAAWLGHHTVMSEVLDHWLPDATVRTRHRRAAARDARTRCGRRRRASGSTRRAGWAGSSVGASPGCEGSQTYHELFRALPLQRARGVRARPRLRPVRADLDARARLSRRSTGRRRSRPGTSRAPCASRSRTGCAPLGDGRRAVLGGARAAGRRRRAAAAEGGLGGGRAVRAARRRGAARAGGPARRATSGLESLRTARQ